jgi:hypothetical protein
MVWLQIYIEEYFIPQVSIHSYNTRLSNNGTFAIPKIKGFVLLLRGQYFLENIAS